MSLLNIIADLEKKSEDYAGLINQVHGQLNQLIGAKTSVEHTIATIKAKHAEETSEPTELPPAA